MAESGSVKCEYLIDNELCKSIIDDEEGKAARQKWCREAAKNFCCYLCVRRESCEISCSYLGESDSLQAKSQIPMSIDQEIEKCKERIERLAVLLADGKIGEQSYAAASRTLEDKIESLKKAKENPNIVISSSKGLERSEEDTSYERPTLLWYLVPFFFGIIGGIVGYVGVKDEDKEMADILLVFGILWSIILAIFYWTLIMSLISNFPR